jgi:hypothetical protein
MYDYHLMTDSVGLDGSLITAMVVQYDGFAVVAAPEAQYPLKPWVV